MTSIPVPDKTQLQDWLEQSATQFYLCGQCNGLHIQQLQDTPGVIDSRLFLEEYGLLLTTELEIRPGALLLVSADLGRLNMDYPTLKVFLDVGDEVVPQLVVAGNCQASAGLSKAQFDLFIATTVEATGHLAAVAQQMGYLYTEAAEASSPLLH
jgi:hypothetical protein